MGFGPNLSVTLPKAGTSLHSIFFYHIIAGKPCQTDSENKISQETGCTFFFICDKHGWIVGYTVHPGNEHDSRTWKPLYDKLKDLDMEMMVLDAGYKTPAITRELLKDGIQPLFPYKRPMTKDGFFKKYEYVYDEYYDCYICSADQILTYKNDLPPHLGRVSGNQ